MAESKKSSLTTLAYLNIGIVAFYVLIVVVFSMIVLSAKGGEQFPISSMILVIAAVIFLVMSPHIYLAMALESGRGRIVQTIMAILSVFNLPIGTAYGIYALWVVWVDAADEFGDEPRTSRSARSPGDFVGEAPEAPLDGKETPYQLVKRMLQSKASLLAIQGALIDKGLPDAEIETLFDAMGEKPPRRTARPSQPKAPPKKTVVRDDDETPLDSEAVRRPVPPKNRR